MEHYRRLGLTESQLLAAYPGLRAADLVNAWAYVAANRDEVERQIVENEGASRLAFHYADVDFPLPPERPCAASAMAC